MHNNTYPITGAVACTDSCLGRNDNLKGLLDFKCSGDEDNLRDCPVRENNGCGEHAGVICRK